MLTLGEFHCVVTLIISHQNSPKKQNDIMKGLYEMCGSPPPPLSPKRIAEEKNLRSIKGLTAARIFTIKSVAEIALKSRNFLTDIQNVKGVGSWTVKLTLILTEKNPSVSLYEDARVKKSLSEILCTANDDSFEKRHCKKIFSILPEESQSVFSYFLFYLKPSGIEKIKLQMPLSREDFF
jgi:3-methyladenine DNA glycosylase/8-oxoguanine DNA glycosylase